MAKRPYPTEANNNSNNNNNLASEEGSSVKKAKTQTTAHQAAALSLMALRHPNVELADSIQKQQQVNTNNSMTKTSISVIKNLQNYVPNSEALFRCQNKDPSAVFFVPIHHVNALSASSSVSGDDHVDEQHKEEDHPHQGSSRGQQPLRLMLPRTIATLGGLRSSTRLDTSGTNTMWRPRSSSKRELPHLLPPLVANSNTISPLSTKPLLAPHLARRTKPLWKAHPHHTGVPTSRTTTVPSSTSKKASVAAIAKKKVLPQ